jgi:hypothetical protein
MQKNTKILLGIGAVIAAYLILKPKKAIGQTPNVNTPTPVKTKDCVVSSYNCVTRTYQTIQIPIDDECYKYQNANPPCAEPLDRFIKPAVMPADWSLVELQNLKTTPF